MTSTAQVVSVALALVVLASAAPIVEKTLWEEQTDLYNAMLQVQDDTLPFDGDVDDKHQGVFSANNETVGARNKYQNDKMVKPFKVSAARDDAENKTRVEQEAHVAESEKAYRDQQNATATAAIDAGDAAITKSDETLKSVTEAVHETLHPNPPAEEATNKEFLDSMAKYAEASDVPMRHGDMFEPDQLGDPYSKTALPSAADMLLSQKDVVPTNEENIVEDMKAQEAAAFKQQQALFDQVLSS